MTDHTFAAHFTVKSGAGMSVADPQTMIIDRMANAVLGGSLGANEYADTLARAKALEVYVMVIAMMQALAEVK